jgi:hypothetical protein
MFGSPAEPPGLAEQAEQGERILAPSFAPLVLPARNMDDSAAAPGAVLPASRWFLLALDVSKFVCLLMAVSPHSLEPHLKFDDTA